MFPSIYQAYKCKKMAFKKNEGDAAFQYSRLWDYAEELRLSNLGSSVALVIDNSSGDVRFDNFDVVLEHLRKV